MLKKNAPFQTSLATPEIVKEQFQAVKLHFSSKNYNYNKYEGKVKKSNYKDIIPYSMIAKGKYKTDFPDFFIPGLFQNPKSNIENFLSEDYMNTWKYWISYQRAPQYYFERELLEVRDYLEKNKLKFDSMFSVKVNEIPIIYKFIVKNQVSPQTLLYLNQVIEFIDRIDSHITETILFPKVQNRLKKLRTFLKPKEKETLKKIVQEVFCS
jgi:hypothetical protein